MLRLLLTLVLVMTPLSVMAQEAAQVSPNPPAENVPQEELLEPVETRTGNPIIEKLMRNANKNTGGQGPTMVPSLFFNNWEVSLLEDARAGVLARVATEEELEDAVDGRPKKGPREISVGGIVYASTRDWAVWLNGQKITPERLPPEILDIQVSRDFVKLKWFDAYTNQIFPIKLKTHQRFNIDTRIFLPG